MRGYRKKRLNNLSPEQLREWRDYNNARNRIYRERDKEKYRKYARNHHLTKTYNITQEEYVKLVEKQKNKCLVCKEVQKQFHIDHCHKTGKIRGLLCGKCNRGIGMLKEDPKILLSAINYLKIYE